MSTATEALEFYLRDNVTLDDLGVEVLGDRIALHATVDAEDWTLLLLKPAEVRDLAHALLRAAGKVVKQ